MTPLIFCELDSADAVVSAVRVFRDRGITGLEAYTPFAIPELEEMLTTRSRIPWAALGAGLVGTCTAFAIIWYCNVYSYPLDVGGRPLNSLPADIPIMFETTVLFAAIVTFALVILRSGLPRLAHPLFSIEGFERVSIDRYWVGIDPTGQDRDRIEAVIAVIDVRAIHRLDRNDVTS